MKLQTMISQEEESKKANSTWNTGPQVRSLDVQLNGSVQRQRVIVKVVQVITFFNFIM